MRLLAARLAVLAAVACAAAPKGGKPLIVRVRKADGAVKRVAFEGDVSLDELHARSGADELFADDACLEACAAEHLEHGAIVYERPLVEEADEEEAEEAFFSPYPALQKKKSLRARRQQQNMRANTWKEMIREREGVFYVKSFERVCDMCRLSQDAVEELSGRGPHAAWLLGRRGARKENATCFAEAAHAVGPLDADVFAVAKLCGLGVVGVAVVREAAEDDDKALALTPYEVALVSELQGEAMARQDVQGGPFSFPTLIIAPRIGGGLATEAFEASALTVQMAAERVLERSDDQPRDRAAKVRTRDCVVVEQEDSSEIDARFLYRAVPVGTLDTATLASAFHLPSKAQKGRKREVALAAHLKGASGKKALTRKLLDIGWLVAARDVLAKGDLGAICEVAAARRADPAAAVPAKVKAAVEALLATVANNGGE